MNELYSDTPICVPCQRNYRCERNGVWVRLGGEAIIDADMYECPGCGHRLIRGFAHRSVERYDPDGRYRKVWGIQSALMGDATITDSKGHPISAKPDGTIPAEDAREHVETTG